MLLILFCYGFVLQSGNDLSQLKRDLEGYREFLLPLNKILEWEENYYPGVLVGSITFVFA